MLVNVDVVAQYKHNILTKGGAIYSNAGGRRHVSAHTHTNNIIKKCRDIYI
jgi:hypothetical protein